MSYKEFFRTILKPWAGIKEICIIANCGRDSAIKIRNHIEKEILKQGKVLPGGKVIQVPMKNVIEHLGLDIDYIIEMATYEDNLNKILHEASHYASLSK